MAEKREVIYECSFVPAKDEGIECKNLIVVPSAMCNHYRGICGSTKECQHKVPFRLTKAAPKDFVPTRWGIAGVCIGD